MLSNPFVYMCKTCFRRIIEMAIMQFNCWIHPRTKSAITSIDTPSNLESSTSIALEINDQPILSLKFYRSYERFPIFPTHDVYQNGTNSAILVSHKIPNCRCISTVWNLKANLFTNIYFLLNWQENWINWHAQAF